MNTIPLRDFFRNPEKTNFTISPKGKNLAFLAPVNQRLNLFVQDRKSGKSRQLTDSANRDIRNYLWVNEDILVYFQDFGGDENYHLYAVSLDGNTHDLTPYEKVQANLLDDLPDREDEILITLNKREPSFFDVYRVNVRNHQLEEVARNPGHITSWITDHQGDVRAAISTNGVTQRILFRDKQDTEYREVIETDFKEGLLPQFFTFDNQRLLCLSNLGRDKLAVVEFDPATGRELHELYAHREVDISALAYSKKRQVLTACLFTNWKLERHFFDPETEQMFQLLIAELGSDKDIYITDHDREEQLFIVRSLSDKSLGAWYLFDKKDQTLELITRVGQWLEDKELASMQPVRFRSRDGLPLNGYLSLPPQSADRPLPTIINPHGGPWHRDVWGYNPEVQFLTNRGFAVLQINFRGSTGYGRAFWEASFKEWGKKMQDDITDGVRWLIEEGIADPKRIGIYGGSYGGYATLAGLCFTPELYACGVDYVGVSNLFTFLQTIPPYWKPYLEMMYEMVGHPEHDKTLLESSSPVFHVDKINVPVLVAQGANDPRVVKAESDQIVSALEEKNIEVQYLVKENEGHGFQNEENRFEFYETMESFLTKHLKT